MRTSRPPGMGRRCAPRRQYRPPSGDPHPGDGAMASRPSRCSTTCSRRLRGSSGPRTRIWAPGGLDRQVYQIEISGKRAHTPAPRDTWRSEDPGKSRKAVKAGRKNQGTVEVYLRNGCAGWGGRPQSVSTTHPDVSRLSVHSAGLAPLTGRLPARGCCGTASARRPKGGGRWLSGTSPR